MVVPSNGDGEGFRAARAGTDGVRAQPLRLEHRQELIAGGEGPGVRTVRHQQQPQRRQTHVLVVFRGQETPVQVT